jgi:UDP-N-acetylmuramyl tripeptide synthase
MSTRTTAAIVAGKLAGSASRALGRGGGTAVAGLVAERIDPDLVARLAAQAGHGAIAVTGTNGKTTTALMLSRIAREAGLLPLHNRSGSNLMRGVAAMLVEEAALSGTIPQAAERLAILEVDEATLPRIVPAARPRAIVFTNLFRDQLDRYGEVDTVAAAWVRAIAQAPDATALVLNADDPAVAYLGQGAGVRRTLYYGIEDVSAASGESDHAADFRSCLRCGAELRYTAAFYGHIGHWRCDSCGNARPHPDIRLTRVEPLPDGQRLAIEADAGIMCVTLPLTGLYNAANALSATAGALALGIGPARITAALEGFSAAFGRQERFSVDGRDVRVMLGKNPAGLNQVLRAIAASPGAKRLLFFLNDGIADGRDVSWIWDADYELLREQCERVLAAGTRAEDLALRLKYAGFGADLPIERGSARALRQALDATPRGETLYVVPTYTAMLPVRERLAKLDRRAGRFWEDA